MRYLLISSILLLLNWTAFGNVHPHATLELSKGQIKGRKVVNSIWNDKEKEVSYIGFYGLQYAQQPTANLRLKPPQPLGVALSDLDHEIDASDPGLLTTCPQLSQHPRTGQAVPPVIGAEDCLKLNVFTPDLDSKDLPVVVFFHGGGHIFGSAVNRSPDYFFVNNDSAKVVFVTVNSRLGVFGFLTLGNDVLNGNLGIKDQIMALEWVQENIHLFGGDKGRVTLFGASAGGRSALAHMMTAKSTGLFHKVISSSGAFRGPSHDPTAAAFAFAEKVGCDKGKVLDCLQNKEMKELTEASSMFETYMFNGNPWAITKDGDLFEDDPLQLLKQGKVANKVPVMLGGVQNEGSFLMPQFINNDRQNIKHLAENFDQFGAHVFHLTNLDQTTEQDTATADILREEYISPGIDTNLTTVGNTLHFRDLMTDLWYLAPIDLQVKLLSQHNDVFYYNYR